MGLTDRLMRFAQELAKRRARWRDPRTDDDVVNDVALSELIAP